MADDDQFREKYVRPAVESLLPVPPLPVIDLTAQPGDVRYECLKCGWAVTLKPEGEALWTKNGTVIPMCRRDKVILIRTVYP